MKAVDLLGISNTCKRKSRISSKRQMVPVIMSLDNKWKGYAVLRALVLRAQGLGSVVFEL